MKKIYLFGLLVGIAAVIVGAIANIKHWEAAQTLLYVSMAGLALVIGCGIGLATKSLPMAKK